MHRHIEMHTNTYTHIQTHAIAHIHIQSQYACTHSRTRSHIHARTHTHTQEGGGGELGGSFRAFNLQICGLFCYLKMSALSRIPFCSNYVKKKNLDGGGSEKREEKERCEIIFWGKRERRKRKMKDNGGIRERKDKR